MIIEMKKINVITQSKDAVSTIERMGRLGVLHIEHENMPSNDDIEDLRDNRQALIRVLTVLEDLQEGNEEHGSPGKLVAEINHLLDRKDALRENITQIKKEIEKWKDWGDFEPELLDDLKSKKIWVRLCKAEKNKIKEAPEEVVVNEIFNKGTMVYCAVASQKEIDLPFDTIETIPEKSLGEMRKELDSLKKSLAEADDEIRSISKYRKSLLRYEKELNSAIEFNKVSAGMGSYENLSYLKGYCPVDKVSNIEETAAKEKWGLTVEDPSSEDKVPTLIRNPKWIRIIKPVFKVINTIPGYREMDISLWFLLFFSVFFGMLIGDAGYGVLFFILNLIAHLKLKNKTKDKSVFLLIYVLSLCAIIWGALTGTFFGQAWLPTTVKPFAPALTDSANVQALCFLIGAVHLSVAHLWRFARKMPSLRAFAEAGWVCMIWGAYFLAKSLILGEVFPDIGKWFFISGSLAIVLLTNPSKNIFRGIGSGIGDLLLNVINSFTDVVSYVRLFAVGAASVAVADAFNQMAMGVGFNGVLSGFIAAFILLFGHTLNIALGGMAILVHGVRLNVLEFSSHLNMEWSGTEYKPFTR